MDEGVFFQPFQGAVQLGFGDFRDEGVAQGGHEDGFGLHVGVRQGGEGFQDGLAQAAGAAAMSDAQYYCKCVQEIKNTRRITEQFFDSLGWRYIKSSANFILFTPKKNGVESPETAADFVDFLRSKRILARYFASDPTVNMSIRLSIGLPEQMQAVMDAATQWAGIKK